MVRTLFCIALFAAGSTAFAEETVILWPDGAPGAIGKEDVDQPSLWIYPADKQLANGTAVVICPGGGYQILAVDHEGTQVAKWYNTFGVTAFVLKYRLAPKYRHPAPMQDVQRAIQYVRAHAKEYHLSPTRIGVAGFSAGGHLASTAATHFVEAKPDAKDPIDQVSSRPDFAVLAYPVITMTQEFGHPGSKKNLLGEKPSEELAKRTVAAARPAAAPRPRPAVRRPLPAAALRHVRRPVRLRRPAATN